MFFKRELVGWGRADRSTIDIPRFHDNSYRTSLEELDHRLNVSWFVSIFNIPLDASELGHLIVASTWSLIAPCL
jgi:hypothetical protein